VINKTFAYAPDFLCAPYLSETGRHSLPLFCSVAACGTLFRWAGEMYGKAVLCIMILSSHKYAQCVNNLFDGVGDRQVRPLKGLHLQTN
jgi:hypothetical protein